uniref:Uncharacterized protein n=1 Tax=Cacopsylla melanoneura TaxID=428564 RepID=A0A8D9AW58_9HEMI
MFCIAYSKPVPCYRNGYNTTQIPCFSYLEYHTSATVSVTHAGSVPKSGTVRFIAGKLGKECRIGPQALLVGYNGHDGHFQLFRYPIVLIIAPTNHRSISSFHC